MTPTNDPSLRTIAVLFAVLLIYIIVFGGLACLLLPAGSFVSLTAKSEIQVLPMSGTDLVEYLRYRPGLSFGGGQFDLQESDYFFSGPYVCRFGTVVASHSNGTATSVGFTPLLGLMLWDRKVYLNITQFAAFLILLFIARRLRRRFPRSLF